MDRSQGGESWGASKKGKAAGSEALGEGRLYDSMLIEVIWKRIPFPQRLKEAGEGCGPQEGGRLVKQMLTMTQRTSPQGHRRGRGRGGGMLLEV